MNPPYRRLVLGVALALGLLGAIPGVAFAANPACGTTIMTSRTLVADLDCSAYDGDAIIFGKKGITFNLGGYTLWGMVGNDNDNGVYTNYKKNVTVKNGTIANYDNAVYAYATVGGVYKNLTINGDSEPYEEGVYIYYGADNLVTNVTTNDVGYGIDVEYSANNWITNNTVNDGYESFYFSVEQGDHISGNHANGYSDIGFYDSDGADNTYTNNHADAMTNGGGYGFDIECNEYGWVTMRNNSATNNSSYGFYVYECYDYYSYSVFKPSVIDGNTANDNPGGGFYDYYSLQAWYTNNTAKRNGDDGFYMDYPGGITFTGNVANRNAGDGVEFTDMGYGNYGNPKSVKNNTANRNDEFGINADVGIGGATGNVALNNGYAPDNCYNIACN
jgi:parallel beta-helix repeat protein